MPLAVVSASHIFNSAGVFEMCRQFGWALAYAPATLVMVWPGITEFATLPCWAQAQTGVSPERLWWSALNQAATWLIAFKSFTVSSPPPRLPTYTDSGLFSRATWSQSRQIVSIRSMYAW